MQLSPRPWRVEALQVSTSIPVTERPTSDSATEVAGEVTRLDLAEEALLAGVLGPWSACPINPLGLTGLPARDLLGVTEREEAGVLAAEWRLGVTLGAVEGAVYVWGRKGRRLGE